MIPSAPRPGRQEPASCPPLPPGVLRLSDTSRPEPHPAPGARLGEGACQEAIRRGLERLVAEQALDGSWRGDYGGPMFLLPMYVAAARIGEHPIPAARRKAMVAYLRSVQHTDGSIGLHVEAEGCCFTTVLGYVALRLLGVAAADEGAARMRRWILANGTALGCASWGKFTLALLGLYEYEGLHPVLPELWLLPRAAPIHPGRLWCHCRQVYLPMAWLYGRRARLPADALIQELRTEIYDRPYGAIPFADHRDTVAPTDSYTPPSALLRLANRVMGLYERLHSTRLRERAQGELLEHIAYEDRVTNFIRIGPVNAVLNTLVHHFREPGGADARRSFATLDGYLWSAPDGTKMNGYNSTALWDTAFAVQAILETPFADEQRAALYRAHDYIRENQVIEDVPEKERYHRHASRGGWPFSDRLHGWPITDCTAEGLKCALALEGEVDEPVPTELLRESVTLILSFQNRDGGWATYERQRGGAWLERLNPSQVFGEIMVDYSYVECTAACLQALARARRRFPGWQTKVIARAIQRGERFLRQRQRRDGSWEGSWAVCFTYGTWFAVSGLLAAGARQSDPALQHACRFLEARQLPDGGWGESYKSCSERRYVSLAASHPVNTAWALLTLVRAGRAGSPAAGRAVRCLLALQEEDGDWPRQTLSGVFNRTALINYENYRRYFPLWALASYHNAHEQRATASAPA